MFSAATADPSIIEQAGPALIGVVATTALGIAAAWVGRLWERRHSHAQWLRDRRHEAAAAFLSASATSWATIVDVHAARKRRRTFEGAATAEREAADREISDAFLELLQTAPTISIAHASVEVLGPDDLQVAALSLRSALLAAADLVETAELDDEFIDRANEAFDEFTRVARRVVGGDA